MKCGNKNCDKTFPSIEAKKWGKKFCSRQCKTNARKRRLLRTNPDSAERYRTSSRKSWRKYWQKNKNKIKARRRENK